MGGKGWKMGGRGGGVSGEGAVLNDNESYRVVVLIKLMIFIYILFNKVFILCSLRYIFDIVK